MECAEYGDDTGYGAAGKKKTAAPLASRIFESRESAADLAISLEEKVKHPQFVFIFVRPPPEGATERLPT